MLVSGEKRTVAMITFLLAMGLLIGARSAGAVPFAAPGNSQSSSALLRVDYVSPPTGWQNVGGPYYFENCWWQRQQFYLRGRATRRIRNKKNSCPGLSYGAGSMSRPVPSLGTRLRGIRR